jgi:hypothetical protein
MQSQLTDLRGQLEQRDAKAAQDVAIAEQKAEAASRTLVDVEVSLREAQAKLRQLEDQCKSKNAELLDAAEVSAGSWRGDPMVD